MCSEIPTLGMLVSNVEREQLSEKVPQYFSWLCKAILFFDISTLFLFPMPLTTKIEYC